MRGLVLAFAAALPAMAFLTADQVHYRFANMTDLAVDTETLISATASPNHTLILQNLNSINTIAHTLSRNGFLPAPARKAIAMYDRPRQIRICEAMHRFAGASSALIESDNEATYFLVGLEARSLGGLLLDAPFLTDIPAASLNRADGYARFPACASELAQDAASINKSWREILDALNRV